ncbi:MAG: response regulator transcription factor [Chloroflexi bacterium]|nr:response regulator transcription factor [Chloroflexota bacterium]
MTMQQWERSSVAWPLPGQTAGVRSRQETLPSARAAVAKARVLVVDDDDAMMQLECLWLSRAGYEVSTARDGVAAWQMFQKFQPHVVVLDGMMPGMDGWALCRRIRETDDTLVLMLSARGDKEDRLRGFLCGCDDYVIKPCEPDELVARIRALLRRAGSDGQLDTLLVLDGGKVQVYLDKQRVTVNGCLVDLTSTEYRILACLAGKRGGVTSHKELLDAAWGGYGMVQDESYDAGRDEIKVYISYLRRKLGDDARSPRIIHTVRTMGYRLADAGQ